MLINNKNICLLLAISFLLGGRLAQANCRLIYPADKSLLTQSTILLVGMCDSVVPVAEIKIINSRGQQNLKVKTHNMSFSRRLRLMPGSTTIVANNGTGSPITIFRPTGSRPAPPDFRPYYLHKDLTLSSKCGLCHAVNPDNKGDYTYIKDKFSCLNSKCHNDMGHKKFQHGPFKRRQCADCHNPHGSFNKDFTRAARSALCFTCHSADKDMITTGKVVHFPVAKGQCTACHDPHESKIEFHLKGNSVSDLCFRCHDKKMLDYKYVHEPAAEGDCNSCHTPHTSKYKNLLYKKGQQLCVTCHEVRKDEFKRRYVHQPAGKDCSICHDPHASATKYHLRTKRDKNGRYTKRKYAIKELCLACHTRLNPKIAKAIISAPVAHKPVQEGKCTTCHTPHSTNFPKQLRAAPQDLCFSCHKKMAKKIKNSLYKHGPVRSGSCVQCHLVHGSKYKMLLRAPFSTKFQGVFNLNKFQLCFNCHNRRVFTDPHSIETGFRNGTTNLHFIHVNNQKKSRYCKSCHDMHASDQEKHIRRSFIFKKHFKINIKFTKTATGGRCVTGCHKPRQYNHR